MLKHRCAYIGLGKKECQSYDTFGLEFEDITSGFHGGGWTVVCQKHAQALKLQYEAEGYRVFLEEVKCPTCGGSGKVSEVKT